MLLSLAMDNNNEEEIKVPEIIEQEEIKPQKRIPKRRIFKGMKYNLKEKDYEKKKKSEKHQKKLKAAEERRNKLRAEGKKVPLHWRQYAKVDWVWVFYYIYESGKPELIKNEFKCLKRVLVDGQWFSLMENPKPFQRTMIQFRKEWLPFWAVHIRTGEKVVAGKSMEDVEKRLNYLMENEDTKNQINYFLEMKSVLHGFANIV